MQGPQLQYSTGSLQAAPECKHDIRDEVSDMDLDLPSGKTVEEAAKGAPAEDLAPDPLNTFASAILDSMKEVEVPKSPKPSKPGKAPKSYRRKEAKRRPSPIARPQRISKPSSDGNDNRKFVSDLFPFLYITQRSKILTQYADLQIRQIHQWDKVFVCRDTIPACTGDHWP